MLYDMTETLSAIEQLARELLVMHAINHSPYTAGDKWDPVPARMVADLVERGRLDYHPKDRLLVVTPTGQRELDHYTRMSIVRDEIGRSPSGKPEPGVGDRALMAWLLMNGGVMRSWGSYPEVDDQVMHVLACGINWDETSSPTDDTWRDSGDTFNEGDRHSGVGSRVTCLCGEVEDLHIVAEVGSYVDLLKAMIT